MPIRSCGSVLLASSTIAFCCRARISVAQKSRMCFAGSIRDVILMKNFDLLSIIGELFAVMLMSSFKERLRRVRLRSEIQIVTSMPLIF